MNAQANTLTVVRGNGEQTAYDPRRQVGVSVYREQEKRFSVGDRIQDVIPGLFGALFGAGVLGWGAGWIGSLTGQSM